jgi:phosphonoacetate hydrolase
VLDKETVCRRFDLPPEREGDVAVIGAANVVIGASEAEHDLSNLTDARLRSHGGVSEAQVPFILNYPLTAPYRQRSANEIIKSHQIFDYAINGVEVDNPLAT